MPKRHYDVLVATDCRLPGGTTGSVAEEITAQADAGYRTALMHLPSSLSATARPFAQRLQQLVISRRCDVVTEESVSADLLVVRHPRVAAELQPANLPRVEVDSVVLVANQAPGEPGGGTQHYDPRLADAAVDRWVSRRPTWIPIGPLVRRNLEQLGSDVELADQDWVNVIDAAAWRSVREGVHRPIRIGRHSRNHALKWPNSVADLLAAYPTAEDLRILVLGGADAPTRLLGGQLPANWDVLPFGSVAPERFLSGLDFFVYYHHPAWVEAFGRSILEALASGAVAVLPPHFQALFGDAAVYAEPADTERKVRELAASAATYQAQSERGIAFVTANFSHATHVRRLGSLGISPTGTPPQLHRPPNDGARKTVLPRRRVLLVSSNGAGVGHLMRLMAIARRLPEAVEPIFLTLSQAVSVVRELGFHVEYLPSRAALDAPHRLWHNLLRARVLELIDELDVRAVIFDGTWPYDGLLEALRLRGDVLSIWSRRAMWRPDVTRHALHVSECFDLILEPGELAASEDRGATTRHQDNASVVGPVTFLREGELLDRVSARDQLGLPQDAAVALVQLGAGNINDITSLSGAVVDALRLGDPDIQIVVTTAAIAKAAQLPEGVRDISIYPLGRYLRAFDIAVAASGYNTFHELMLARVPTVFVPNTTTATDDQLARGRWAERNGLARCVENPSPEVLRSVIREAMAPEERVRMHDRHQPLPSPTDGGSEAAERLTVLLDDPLTTLGDSLVAPSGQPTQMPLRREDASGSRVVLGLRVRRLVNALPVPLRTLLLRLWRLARRGKGPPDSRRITLPTGRGHDASVSTSTRGVMVVIPEQVQDEDLDAIVKDAATIQRTFGRFAPLFVTNSARLAPFREMGYAVEMLPDRASLGSLIGDVRAEFVRVERLRRLRCHYAVEDMVVVSDLRLARTVLAGASELCL